MTGRLVGTPRRRLSAVLGDFPWDTIAEAAARARAHPDGIVDLSVGTPVDPTPELGRRALAEAADSPGYPTTIGTPALREAIVAYLTSRWDAVGMTPAHVQPVIGTKEAVAWLPTHLGLGADDTVLFPTTAYPTYAVGARLVGARPVAADDPETIRERRPALVWLNSPSNPTGATLPPERLRALVEAAREVGAVVASDECYGEFGWDVDPWSVLHPDISDGDPSGLLVLHSLSKRSNLAGYRAGFLAGDPELIGELTQIRKHGGMLMPGPVQHAMAVLLGDRDHVEEQRDRYRRRRETLAPALRAWGVRIDHSEAGLYLWCTRGEDSRATVDRLADLGVLAAPGDFYGEAGREHVRIALTATDERIDAAAERLRTAT